MEAKFIDLVKFHLELSILFEDLRRSQGYRITLESHLFSDVSSYISFSSYNEGKQPVLESQNNKPALFRWGTVHVTLYMFLSFAL